VRFNLRRVSSLEISPWFLSVAGWSVLVVRLKTDPNPMAMMVHTKQMTLYGMLKSGVGRDTSSVSVCSLKTMPLGSKEETRRAFTESDSCEHLAAKTQNTAQVLFTVVFQWCDQH